MRLYRKSIADFIWDCIVFPLAALRWRKTVPPTPAKPYSQADAVATSITNLKGAGK